MTPPSDRITIRMSSDQAELLRALAYEFHNSPSSLALIYTLSGMDMAIARGSRLNNTHPMSYRADVLEGLRLARELGLVAAAPSGASNDAEA